MLLGFVNSVKEYFKNVTESSLVDFIPFILGIVVGFILCFLIYLLIFVISIKRDTKNVDTLIIDDDVIKQTIENYKDKYFKEMNSKKTSEKIANLKNISWDLIQEIARIYYPNSQYPLFELSVEELISLDYYIMRRIEKIFSGKVLSKIKKMKIASVVRLLDMKKKYEESKVVRTAEKIKLKPIAKGIWTTLNFFNPVYWVRKLMFDIPYNIITNKISSTIIEVIGVETSNIYSKKAFIKEDVDEEIKQLEKMIGDDNNE